MTNTKMCQGCSEVFRVGELLLLIHRRFCIHSQTFARYGKKGSEVRLDREIGRNI